MGILHKEYFTQKIDVRAIFKNADVVETLIIKVSKSHTTVC